MYMCIYAVCLILSKNWEERFASQTSMSPSELSSSELHKSWHPSKNPSSRKELF